MKKNTFFIALFFIINFISGFAFSKNLFLPVPGYCTQNIFFKTTPIFVDPSTQGVKTAFTYFSTLENLRNTKTTLIALPGGPGGAGTWDLKSEDEAADGWTVARGYPLISLDSRGVGCNATSELSRPEFYLSEVFAEDVAQLIENEKLNNYVILGVSYGSQWATYLSSALQKRNLPQPQSFVMMGTLGKAWPADRSAAEDYNEQFQKQFSDLTPEAQKMFHDNKLPISVSSFQLASYIHRLLYFGIWVEKDNSLQRRFTERLNGLAAGDPETIKLVQTAIDGFPKQYSATQPTISKDIVYNQINCREMLNDETPAFDMTQLKITTTQSKKDVCQFSKGYSDKLFDSKNHQIQVPIIYLEGQNDPATPEWQSRYHFNNQITSKLKIYLSTPGGGHSGTMTHLADCKDFIWNTILDTTHHSLVELALAHDKCVMKPNVEILQK